MKHATEKRRNEMTTKRRLRVYFADGDMAILEIIRYSGGSIRNLETTDDGWRVDIIPPKGIMVGSWLDQNIRHAMSFLGVLANEV